MKGVRKGRIGGGIIDGGEEGERGGESGEKGVVGEGLCEKEENKLGIEGRRRNSRGEDKGGGWGGINGEMWVKG